MNAAEAPSRFCDPLLDNPTIDVAEWRLAMLGEWKRMATVAARAHAATIAAVRCAR